MSGNVYADLGFPNPELEQRKADLALAIIRAMREQRLTIRQAGKLMGNLPPTYVTRIMHGRLDPFSEQDLTHWLGNLTGDGKPNGGAG